MKIPFFNKKKLKYDIMSNEIYTDLENKYVGIKHEALRMETIEFLVEKYSDDKELGEKVREFVKVKEEK